jgi:hypothetical protein
MLQLTMNEALEREDIAREQRIYIYRDQETILYVGRSIHPFQRLQEHLGNGVYISSPDAIGQLILDNRPDSLTWTIEIQTLQELASSNEYDLAIQSNTLASLAEDIEGDVIYRLKPCMNLIGAHNRNKTPAKYINAAKIANQGAKYGRI